MEIFEQCSNVINQLESATYKPILFSAMGIGDPLDNYHNYIASVMMLLEKFPQSKFSLATRVPNYDKIRTLGEKSKDINMKLMISLHSANPNIRSMLIPNSIPIHIIMEHGRYYFQKSGNPLEYNVTLINGVNDSDEDATSIAKLLKTYDAPNSVVLKINRFNTIPNSPYRPSPRVNEFSSILKDWGINVEYYETDGDDIGAACGQMVSN